MYRIGEFSRIVGMTVKALRYYDEIDLLKPAQIRQDNGYRYYDSNNYKKALWIKTLKKYNFTIKEIQEVLPNITNDSDLAVYLAEKQEHIELKILSMRQMHKQINQEIEILKEVRFMSEVQKVEVIKVEDMQVASLRYKGRYEDVGDYLGKLYKAVGMKGINSPFSLYYDEAFTEENADVEVCVEVKGPVNKGAVVSKTLQGGSFVSVKHIGSYDTLSRSYKAIADYMSEHNLKSKVPSREIYLKGPGMLFKGNPDKYETIIMLQLEQS